MFEATVSGRLAKDAGIRTINGNDYLCLDIPVRKRKDDYTTWVSVRYRKNPNGEALQKYLVKGASVLVRGGITIGTYGSKTGEAKIDITVWANQLEITGFVEQGNGQIAPEAKKEEDLPFD